MAAENVFVTFKLQVGDIYETRVVAISPAGAKTLAQILSERIAELEKAGEVEAWKREETRDPGNGNHIV